MKNWMPYAMLLAGSAYIAFSFVSQEYANIRSAIGETKSKTDAVADETKATMEAIKQTIEDLRSKFMTLEMQMAKQTEQKTVDDVAEEQPKPAVKPTIVMHTTAGCPPCEQWKQLAKPVWEAIGWNVVVLPPEPFVTQFPWFEITDSDGVKFESVGYLTRETFARDKLTSQSNLKATK